MTAAVTATTAVLTTTTAPHHTCHHCTAGARGWHLWHGTCDQGTHDGIHPVATMAPADIGHHFAPHPSTHGGTHHHGGICDHGTLSGSHHLISHSGTSLCGTCWHPP